LASHNEGRTQFENKLLKRIFGPKRDEGIDGRILLKTELKEIRTKGMDWFHVAEDRDQ
jgi:hypothetical protein